MVTDTTRLELTRFLKRNKADHKGHTGRTLMRHLIGTYDLLKKWNCGKSVCIAGALHSIYGTNVFLTATLSRSERVVIRNKFGVVAERMAWLFGSLDRPKAIERGYGTDRRRNVKVVIGKYYLTSLRLIEAANLLEQGVSLERFPNIKRELERQQRRVDYLNQEES